MEEAVPLRVETTASDYLASQEAKPAILKPRGLKP